MIHRPKAVAPLKQILILIAAGFALAALLLTIWLTSAATATGSSPTTAISLIRGMNTGILGPGEQRWFELSPDDKNGRRYLEKSLTLTFSPPHNQYLSLQIFDQEQLQFFQPGDASQMNILGTAQQVPDSNSDTDMLRWIGNFLSNQTYYIQVVNNSDFAVDYWLTAENISSDAPDVAVAESSAETVVPSAAVPEMGINPGNAAPILPGLNQNSLPPGATHWYTFTQNDPTNSKQIQDIDFSLFFTAPDGNRQQNVNFELFTANTVEAWLRGDHSRLTNFGAGMLVSRDGDTNTGERIWNGTVVRGDTYYLAVENDSGVAVDYWLFDDDIYNPELGAKTQPAAVPLFEPGQAPQTAIPLNFGQNIGDLNPGEEVWYSFSMDDNDDEYFEEIALTMVATPNDGNRIHHITFQVFTAASVKNWSPDNPTNISNVGAGSLVVRDNNSLTGERFWTGWVVENNLHYVQVQNGAGVPIDYWLFTDDVYGPELGQNVSDK